jgi:hypothetical protein
MGDLLCTHRATVTVLIFVHSATVRRPSLCAWKLYPDTDQNWVRSAIRSRTPFAGLVLSLMSFSQPDPRAPAVLLDELDASGL